MVLAYNEYTPQHHTWVEESLLNLIGYMLPTFMEII